MSDDVLDPRSAERLRRAARAVQTLSETLWEALHEELTDPRAQRVTELSERLAEVSTTMASLARAQARRAREPSHPQEPSSSREPSQPPQEPLSSPPREEPASRERPSTAVLVDERARAAPISQEQPAPPESSARTESSSPRAQPPPEIEIRDERGERDPTAWIASIGRRLERYEQDGLGFAVLLVELADIERLRHAELPGEVARMMGLVEAALAGELRPADSLTRESPGRYWLMAPETDSNSARALAERLTDAVRTAAGHRGTPLEVAVGVAACPEDGSQAAALAAHADIGLYAARASGRPIAP